jgi:hypothetical protein
MDKNLPIKEIFFVLLSVIATIIFTPFLQSTFDTIIKECELNKVVNSLPLDVLVLVTTWIFISLWVNKCRETIPNKKTTLLLLLVSGFYTYQRFFNNHFFFENFKIIGFFKYFDIIYVIVLFDLGNYLKYTVTKNLITKNKNVLEEDSPITNPDYDELDGLFSKTVNKIKNIIEQNTFEISYTIGINSEWGDGKSTILNILKNSIEKDKDKIVVDFNPWMGFDKKVLIKDFFNSLSEALTENNISNYINEYSKELINEVENPIIQFIKSLIFKDKSLETYFDEINSRIKFINKKIVIFVDDVDRLDNEEIFQLLKLIRNAANFNKVYFVIAYDRDYVINSISNINNYSAVNYLDKIINTEITLPYFDRSILKEIFKRKLIEKIGTKYAEKIDYTLNVEMSNPAVFSNAENTSNDFINWISNIRQIKKITNSILINFEGLFDEINFRDLVYIELLKIKYPTIYRMIYVRKDDIFKEVKGILYILRLNEKSDIDLMFEK